MSGAPLKEKVAIIGSGNWGSAIARFVGANILTHEEFDPICKMWVFEETFEGRKLTEIINTDHENKKYLPGHKLPESIVAVPDLEAVCADATILVFVLPHQFLPRLLPQIKRVLRPEAKAISLIKGIDFNESGVVLISGLIADGLGVDCSVLMGANVANEVAQDQFCEATIGAKDAAQGELYVKLFSAPTFMCNVVSDTVGVELCGALKNIVAIAAGFSDGLGFGGNTKAALIRIGLAEMIRFCKRFYKGISDQTFLESCGVADLITTCYGGRNRKCAEAFVKTGKSWDELEAEILDGQKLQGTLTAKEVYEVLRRAGLLSEFPFFHTVYKIAFEGEPPAKITHLEKPVFVEDAVPAGKL